MTSLSRSPALMNSARLTRLGNRALIYLILSAGAIFTLLPFLWIILTSFKTATEIIHVPPTFLPEKWTLQSYITIFTDPKVPLAVFYANSLFVTSMRVVLTLFTSSLAGYIFCKYRFWGRNASFAIILAQMMIPFQVVMIPEYLILVKLHLIDSLWGLIIPSMVDAFGIFMMRQFIETIPNEMIDSGRIDGATEWQIYWGLVLPQLGPALAALGIFTFLGVWNDYLWPLIVITTQEKRTLPLLLNWYNTQHGTRYDLTMAASILVMLPVLIAYLIFQRWIVRGIAMTGFR
jgi:multiple sugar transport system permease protein